jgi:hypothetical protein
VTLAAAFRGSQELALSIALIALIIGLIAISKLPRSVFTRRQIDSDVDARMHELELEMSTLRRELDDAQERLDFAERMIARNEEARVVPRV